MSKEPIENRIASFIFYAGFLWIDRILVRLAVIAPVLLVVFLIYEPVRTYGMIVILSSMAFASIWAIVDLARGIELDHKHKNKTLRDSIVKND